MTRPFRPVGSRCVSRNGYVSAAVRGALPPKALRLHQRDANHSRQDEKEDRENLQKRAEQRTEPGVRFVPGREHALDDRLVAAPVPDTQNRVTQQDRIPRQPGRIARRAEDVQEVARRPVDLAVGHSRERMRMRGQERGHRRPAADFQVTHDRDDHRADQ